MAINKANLVIMWCIFMILWSICSIVWIIIPAFSQEKEPEIDQAPDPSAILGPGTEEEFILQGEFGAKPSMTSTQLLPIIIEDFEQQLRGGNDYPQTHPTVPPSHSGSAEGLSGGWVPARGLLVVDSPVKKGDLTKIEHPAQAETPRPSIIVGAGLTPDRAIPGDIQIYCAREHTVRDHSGKIVGLETEGPYGEFSRKAAFGIAAEAAEEWSMAIGARKP